MLLQYEIVSKDNLELRIEFRNWKSKFVQNLNVWVTRTSVQKM